MSKKDEDKVIKGVYEGKYTVANLPVEVYALNYTELMDGVFLGFGEYEFESPAFELIKYLESNIHYFSGAKTADEIFQIQKQIFDLDGFKRSFSEFKRDAAKVYEAYNTNWLQAEYQTAIASSRQSDEWITIQETKELFPLLRYTTVGDARVRDEHAELDGIIKPVDDEFWDYAYPPSGFRCRCIAEQLDVGEVTKTTPYQTRELKKNVDPLFQMNSGKDKIVFQETGKNKHPYFKGEGMPPKIKEVFEIEKKNRFKQLRIKFNKTQNDQKRQVGI